MKNLLKNALEQESEVDLIKYIEFIELRKIENFHFDLIEIALDEVISNLSPEDQQRLEEVESHYYMDLQQYESGELSDD